MILKEEGGSFAEEAVEFVMVYIDPVLTIYYTIAVLAFAIAVYNKPELRLFIITFACILMSIIMMLLHAHEAEAIFLCISGVSSIVSIFYYRIKVNKNSSGVSSSG